MKNSYLISKCLPRIFKWINCVCDSLREQRICFPSRNMYVHWDRDDRLILSDVYVA